MVKAQQKKDVSSSFRKSFKSKAKRAWTYFWHGDSLGSWILNIVVAFIIIKFIIYPLLALAFGTQLPIVAVVSGSMEHDGSFDQWWDSLAYCSSQESCTQAQWYENKNISYENFSTYAFSNGFNKGDLIILKGVAYQDLSQGDVVVFYATPQQRLPIIHRVVSLENKTGYLQTKGDHNTHQIQHSLINETNIHKDQLVGKAIARVPFVGYVKIGFVEFINLLTGNSLQAGDFQTT